jgi:hypothetical protein
MLIRIKMKQRYIVKNYRHLINECKYAIQLMTISKFYTNSHVSRGNELVKNNK